jgi:hypothetical protein
MRDVPQKVSTSSVRGLARDLPRGRVPGHGGAAEVGLVRHVARESRVVAEDGVLCHRLPRPHRPKEPIGSLIRHWRVGLAAAWAGPTRGDTRRGYAAAAGTVKDGFGSLLLRRHAPALAVLGDTQALAQGRRFFRFGGAEPAVIQDAADGEGVALGRSCSGATGRGERPKARERHELGASRSGERGRASEGALDMRTSLELIRSLNYLRFVTECNMEEGSLRCDANVCGAAGHGSHGHAGRDPEPQLLPQCGPDHRSAAGATAAGRRVWTSRTGSGG